MGVWFITRQVNDGNGAFVEGTCEDVNYTRTGKYSFDKEANVY